MKIVIAGCGNIGLGTAKLIGEQHSILLVDIKLHEGVQTFLNSRQNIHFAQIDAMSLLDGEPNDGWPQYMNFLNSADVLITTVGAGLSTNAVSNFEGFTSNFDLNLFANLIPVKAVLHSMIERQSGQIMVLSSTSGHHAEAALTAYGPSKWALESVCRSLKAELLPLDVRINIICPRTIKNSAIPNSFVSSNGISVEKVAEKIVKVLKDPKRNIHFVPRHYWFIHFIERMLPFIFDKKAGLKRGRRRNFRQIVPEKVLITGASSGLGRELALLYGQHCKELYLVARNKEKLSEVKEKIEGCSQCRVRIDCVDLGDREQRTNYCNSVGNIDLIINGAAISTMGNVIDTPIERYRELLGVNFYAPVHLISEFLKKKDRPKKVINVLSTTAIAGRKGRSCYSLTKSALWAFTRSLRRVYGNEIQILEAVPSPFDSSLAHERKRKNRLYGLLQPDLATRTVAERVYSAERAGREKVFIPLRAKLFMILEASCPWVFRKLFG
jgi:short-subunit dehydrogenase